jgi:hypothetical protein
MEGERCTRESMRGGVKEAHAHVPCHTDCHHTLSCHRCGKAMPRRATRWSGAVTSRETRCRVTHNLSSDRQCLRLSCCRVTTSFLLSFFPSICLSICLSFHLSIHLSITPMPLSITECMRVKCCMACMRVKCWIEYKVSSAAWHGPCRAMPPYTCNGRILSAPTTLVAYSRRYT